jgi:hypothetical protein
MAQTARFIDGPLDGEVFMMRSAPPVLYVRRSVDTEGVTYVPDLHEPVEILRAGIYRREAPSGSSPLYRFEE